MLKIHKILILFLIIQNFSILKPIIGYTLLNKDNKFILILHDNHSKFYNDLNEHHIKKFIAISNKYKQPSPITCILEDGGQNIDQTKHDIEINWENSPCSDVTQWALINEIKSSLNIKLIPYDCREYVTYNINVILDDFNRYSACNNQFDLKKFEKNISYKSNIHLIDYFIYLKKSVITNINWLKLYPINSLVYKELKFLYLNYYKNVSAILRFTSCLKENTNFDKILINYLNNRQVNYVEYMRNSDNYFADIGFFNITMKYQNNNKTILIVGDWHAQNLKKSFKNIGYNVMYSQILVSDDSESMQNFSDNLYNTIDLFFTIQVFNKENNNSICANAKCNKNLLTKFIVCELCKKKIYCNRYCQLMDWVYHKYSCKMKS